jgi:hypothetical protein
MMRNFKDKKSADMIYMRTKPSGYWTVMKRLKDGYSVNTQLSEPNTGKDLLTPVLRKRYNK